MNRTHGYTWWLLDNIVTSSLQLTRKNIKQTTLSHTSPEPFGVLAVQVLWQLVTAFSSVLPWQSSALGESCWHGEFNASWWRHSMALSSLNPEPRISSLWHIALKASRRSLQYWTLPSFLPRTVVLAWGREVLRGRWPCLLGWDSALLCSLYAFCSFALKHCCTAMSLLCKTGKTPVCLLCLFSGA